MHHQIYSPGIVSDYKMDVPKAWIFLTKLYFNLDGTREGKRMVLAPLHLEEEASQQIWYLQSYTR